MKIVIYSIINTVNNKRYVGVTQDFKTRKRIHEWGMKSGKHKNKKLVNDVIKYGYDKFVFEILEEFNTDDNYKKLEKEAYYIKKYNSCDNGYNGSYGFDFTNDVLMSDYNKKQISQRLIGNKYWLGKKHTEEAKLKIGKAHKNKIVSKETRLKQSEYRKENFVGEKNPFYNKHHTEETKLKLAKKNGKPILCIETNKKYDSINQCSKEMGIDRKAIERVCKGIYKQAKGYTFKFI